MNYASENRECSQKSKPPERGKLKDVINYKKVTKRNNMNLTNREYIKNRRFCSLL